MGDTQPKPICSYTVFDPASRRITQVKEKVKISDHANTYVLRMDSILVRARSDQVPKRKNMGVEEVEKWLGPNLGYDNAA